MIYAIAFGALLIGIPAVIWYTVSAGVAYIQEQTGGNG